MALQEEFEKEGNWLFRYRSYLPIVLLVIGILTCVFFAPVRAMAYWNYYEYVCLTLSLLGVAIRIFTVGHTPAGTSGRNTEKQVAESLNTTSIYSLVRHSLYLGNFLIYLGIAMLTFNSGFILAFMLIYWLYYERIMFAEEQFLRRKFGDTYVKWASCTPAFIPSFRRYVPSSCSFSWKKVIKKEKNGIFALFLTFSLFDVVIRQVGGKHGVNSPLLMATAITGIAYVILKILKKRTQILNEEGR